jgi:hypothetical protein
MIMKSTSLVRASVLAALTFAGGAYAAEMTLYSNANFRGNDLTISGEARNLDRSGFNDRTESLVVRSGRWEVCTDANFAGYCAVLGPGNYRALDGPLFRSISSAREIAPIAYNEPAYRYGAYEPYPRVAEPVIVEPRIIEQRVVEPRIVEPRSRYSALEVYTLPGFRGSTMRFDAEATTLDKATTTEGVSSLIVREGVWELCTGTDNSGSCRVYEPGRYPRLGSFEGAPVGSLRRVG